jgi:DNA-binding transcriptional ArsR family regulator
MENTQVKDAVTGKQTLFLEITDKDVLKLFQDENLMQILTFLRSTPYMTVRDLEESFKTKGNEKSDKSIYRYLKRLEEGNLVVPAGKRVKSSPNEKLKTETLYMRTAKMFFPKIEDPEPDPETKLQLETFDDVLSILIGNHLGLKINSVEDLSALTKELKLSIFESSTNLLKSADEDTANLISTLNWKSVNYLINTLGLITLVIDENDWKERIYSCFEK